MAKANDYRVLTAEERLALVRDYLRSAETEHYRLWVSSPNDPSREERVANAAAEMNRLQTEYDDAEKDAGKGKNPQPTPPASPPPADGT